MYEILIIDDEEDFCNLIKKNLEETGEFKVHIATSGRDGIELAKEVRPDLILLDILMPEMDGSDTCASIKKDDSIKDTPIIFLSAIVSEEETSSQLSLARGYALLSKTVTLRELISCIKNNVRRYE